MSDPPSEIGIYVGKPKKKQSRTLSLPRSSACECVGGLDAGACVGIRSLCVFLCVCVRVSLRARAFPCICAILCVHTSSELTQADVHLVDSRNLSSAGYASM